MMDVAHLREADQQHAEALARLDHAIGYSRSGLHAALIANGGALIGLFTLIAPQRDLAARLWGAGLSFSAGLVVTLAAWMLATLAQDLFQSACTRQAWNAEARAAGMKELHDFVTPTGWGRRFLHGAYAATIASLFLFLAGCILTLHALASVAGGVA